MPKYKITDRPIILVYMLAMLLSGMVVGFIKSNWGYQFLLFGKDKTYYNIRSLPNLNSILKRKEKGGRAVYLGVLENTIFLKSAVDGEIYACSINSTLIENCVKRTVIDNRIHVTSPDNNKHSSNQNFIKDGLKLSYIYESLSDTLKAMREKYISGSTNELEYATTVEKHIISVEEETRQLNNKLAGYEYLLNTAIE